jgi:hypothetical protein
MKGLVLASPVEREDKVANLPSICIGVETGHYCSKLPLTRAVEIRYRED